MRINWNTVFAVAVIVAFAAVTGMGLFLIFSGRNNLENKKKSETLTNKEANIISPSWSKVMNYQKEHPKLLKSRTLELMFSGEITAVSADSLTIKGEGGDLLTFDSSKMPGKASVFEVPIRAKNPGQADLKRLSYETLAVGDTVSVNVSVIFDTGAERITSIGRVPK